MSTQTTTGHTPTPPPWTTEDWAFQSELTRGLIGVSTVWAVFAQGTEGKDNKMPAECYGPDAEANAKMIVLAVNSHAELLAACFAMFDAMNPEEKAVAFTMAEAAIANAQPASDTLQMS